MGQHKISKTEEKKEMYFVLFSREQKNQNMENKRGITFAKLDDGRIVEYTEMCTEEKPSGSFINDYVLLGKGSFSHIVFLKNESNLENTEGIIIPSTISRAGIDSLYHTAQRQREIEKERFKLKSPKNIFKKRPFGYF